MPEPIIFPGHETQFVGVQRRVLRLERRPLPFIIVDHIKIFGDRTVTKVREKAFAYTVSDDVTETGLDVVAFKAYVTTTGGACSLKLWNDTNTALITTCTIPSGEYHKLVPTDDVDECANYIDDNDRFRIETTAAGGTKGLGVYVYYGHDKRP